MRKFTADFYGETSFSLDPLRPRFCKRPFIILEASLISEHMTLKNATVILHVYLFINEAYFGQKTATV